VRGLGAEHNQVVTEKSTACDGAANGERRFATARCAHKQRALPVIPGRGDGSGMKWLKSETDHHMTQGEQKDVASQKRRLVAFGHFELRSDDGRVALYDGQRRAVDRFERGVAVIFERGVRAAVVFEYGIGQELNGVGALANEWELKGELRCFLITTYVVLNFAPRLRRFRKRAEHFFQQCQYLDVIGAAMHDNIVEKKGFFQQSCASCMRFRTGIGHNLIAHGVIRAREKKR
jgi:hypothetical protein